MNAQARYLVRVALFGIGAANAALLTGLYAGEALDQRFILVLVSLGVGSALSYAGIGAAVPQVEGTTFNRIAPAQAVAEAVATINAATGEAADISAWLEEIEPT